MKTRINITIQESVLKKAKLHATKQAISLSQMIEDYLESLTKPKTERKNIISMVDELPSSGISNTIDLKREYYEAQKGKHGL